MDIKRNLPAFQRKEPHNRRQKRHLYCAFVNPYISMLLQFECLQFIDKGCLQMHFTTITWHLPLQRNSRCINLPLVSSQFLWKSVTISEMVLRNCTDYFHHRIRNCIRQKNNLQLSWSSHCTIKSWIQIAEQRRPRPVITKFTGSIDLNPHTLLIRSGLRFRPDPKRRGKVWPKTNVSSPIFQTNNENVEFRNKKDTLCRVPNVWGVWLTLWGRTSIQRWCCSLLYFYLLESNFLCHKIKPYYPLFQI